MEIYCFLNSNDNVKYDKSTLPVQCGRKTAFYVKISNVLWKVLIFMYSVWLPKIGIRLTKSVPYK